MKGENIGGEGFRRGTISLADDMGAYDRLPQQVKEYLRSMSINWNADAARKLIAGHGVEMTMQVLEKTERDMQSAYQERIPCLS